MRTLPTLAPLAALLLLPVLAFCADPPKPRESAAKKAQAEDVELLADAYRLAEFAEKHQAPEAYVTAGSLVLKLKARTKGQMARPTDQPQVADAAGKEIPNARPEANPPESLDDIADGFFTAASALGVKLKTSAEVEALVKAARARAYAPADVETRGPVGGPRVYSYVLAPKATHTYHVPFDVYNLAAVGVQASGPVRCKMWQGPFQHYDQLVRVGKYVWKPQSPRNQETVNFGFSVHNPNNFPVNYTLLMN